MGFVQRMDKTRLIVERPPPVAGKAVVERIAVAAVDPAGEAVALHLLPEHAPVAVAAEAVGRADHLLTHGHGAHPHRVEAMHRGLGGGVKAGAVHGIGGLARGQGIFPGTGAAGPEQDDAGRAVRVDPLCPRTGEAAIRPGGDTHRSAGRAHLLVG